MKLSISASAIGEDAVMNNRRLLFAFLLAPLLPSIIVFLAFGVKAGSAATIAIFFSLAFSYVPCILFGFPLIAILSRINALTTSTMALSGGFLGAIVYCSFLVFLSQILSSSRNFLPSIGGLFFGGILGASVALAFSLIAGFPLFPRRGGGKKGGQV